MNKELYLIAIKKPIFPKDTWILNYNIQYVTKKVWSVIFSIELYCCLILNFTKKIS